MARNFKRKQMDGSNPLVAITAALLCLGFVVFVFIYDDLKREPFVQGLTGLIVALTISVVLFSAVPGSKAVVRLPIGLAGAAAFYFLILPRIQPFIFPSYSFSARVAYESKNEAEEGFEPVEGAEVEIKDTGLRAKTDITGNFTIPNIPSQITVKELIISWAGRSYQIEVKKYPDKIYRIRHEPVLKQSSEYIINPDEWAEDKDHKCQPVEKNKYSILKQFSLRKTVPTSSGFSDLSLRIWSEEGAEIISARKVEPQEGHKVQDAAGYARAQKWSIPVSGNATTVRLLACLGAGDGVSLSRSHLKASYWFEKVE